MTAEEFINKYKQIDSMNGYRLSSSYTTDNKKYIWREDETKLDPQDHHVVIKRENIHHSYNNDSDYGRLYMTIAKDAPDDPFYQEENMPYAEADVYYQDDNQTDDEFYNRCIDLLNSENLNIDDDYSIFQIVEDGDNGLRFVNMDVRKPVSFE